MPPPPPPPLLLLMLYTYFPVSATFDVKAFDSLFFSTITVHIVTFDVRAYNVTICDNNHMLDQYTLNAGPSSTMPGQHWESIGLLLKIARPMHPQCWPIIYNAGPALRVHWLTLCWFGGRYYGTYLVFDWSRPGHSSPLCKLTFDWSRPKYNIILCKLYEEAIRYANYVHLSAIWPILELN